MMCVTNYFSHVSVAEHAVASFKTRAQSQKETCEETGRKAEKMSVGG